MTAPVVTLDEGRQVIRQESSTYFARYRDQDKVLITVSTGCRDESAAKQVLADLEKRVERIKSGVFDASGRRRQRTTETERRSSSRRLRFDADGVGNAPGEHPMLPQETGCRLPMDPPCRHAAFRPGMLAVRASPAETVGTVPQRLPNGACVVLQLVCPGRSDDGQPLRQAAESEPRRRPSTETPGHDAGRTGQADRTPPGSCARTARIETKPKRTTGKASDRLNASQATTEPTCTRSWREPDCGSTRSGNWTLPTWISTVRSRSSV